MRAPGRLVLWFLAAGLGALGLLVRLFLLWHKSINSDEAVVGLMARDILHGHFTAFYWGQDYGGVEPYVTAALFGVFGQNDVTLNLAPVVLSAVSSVLVWRIARYVLDEPVAVLVGLATWVWPVAVVVYSAQESGFRYATLTLGLAAVLFATQIRRKGSTWPRWLCFGLAIGACVWSSPESVYFVVPCALLAIPALLSSRDGQIRCGPPRDIPGGGARRGSSAVVGGGEERSRCDRESDGRDVPRKHSQIAPFGLREALGTHRNRVAAAVDRHVARRSSARPGDPRSDRRRDCHRFRPSHEAPAGILENGDTARKLCRALPGLLCTFRPDHLLERRALCHLLAVRSCNLRRIRLLADPIALGSRRRQPRPS